MLERFLTHGSWPPDVDICMYMCATWAQWWLFSAAMYEWGVGMAITIRKTNVLLTWILVLLAVPALRGSIKPFMVFILCPARARGRERESPKNCWQFSILILRIGSQSLWKTSHGIRVHLPWGMRQNAGLKFIGRTRPRISLRPTDWHILYPFPLAARNGAIINSFRHLFDISTRRNLIVLFAPVFVFVFRSPRICVLNDMYKGWANINPFRCVEVCGKQRPGEWSNIKRLGRGDAVIAWLISGQMAPDTNDYLMLQFTLYWFARIRLCLCQHNRGIMSSCHGQALN